MMSRSMRGRLVIVLSGVLTLIVGLWAIDLAAAQTSGDGRINLIAPLGGATIYCVDASMQPAPSYVAGGIRVLDMDGIEVLFAPAASIPAPGADPIMLAEGQGRYSLLTLYLLPSSEFQLNGVDDKGQPFEFRWIGCTQQGPAVSTQGVQPGVLSGTETPTPTATSTLTPTPISTPCDAVALCNAACPPNPFDPMDTFYLVCRNVCLRHAHLPGGICGVPPLG